MLHKPPKGLLPDLSYPLMPDLGYWFMNENSGSLINDLSGNGNNGAFVNSPSWVFDPMAGVLTEDAGDRYIVVPHKTILNPTGDFTAFVSYSSTDTGAYTGIIGKYAANNCWVINQGTVSGRVRGQINNQSFETTTTWNDGKMHQVVLVRRGTNAKLYVDGKQEAEDETSGDPITNTADLWIGGWTTGTAYILDGTIYYAGLFNRALSTSEIPRLYREPLCLIRKRRRIASLYVFGAPPSFVPFPELLRRNAMNPLRGVA